ncbi:hypothetical protein [Streptomyces sp. NPDC053427]
MNEPKPLTCMFATPPCICYCLASQFMNIWLRTKRKNADGKVLAGLGIR